MASNIEMKRTSTKIFIPVFSILTLLSVIIFVAATYRNMRQTEIQSIKVKSSLKFLVITESLVTHLQNVDNTQHGYILSKEDFNVPYSKAIEKLASDTTQLNRMLPLLPERVNVPVPFLVKAIAPVPITPEKVVDVLLLPVIKAGVPPELVIVPAPCKSPAVILKVTS